MTPATLFPAFAKPILAMPRTARASAAGYCDPVLNRGNARATVFHKEGALMAEATVRVPMRILASCLMPNHIPRAFWPPDGGDLSRWMHWLLTTHVRRYLRHDQSSGPA